MAKRIALVLSDSALEIVRRCPERKRGAWVSQQLLSADNSYAALAEIARRLQRIEVLLERWTLRE